MKSKVLLLSDDIRGSSGVSHISQKIVTETVDEFDWVQISALRNHPENNYLVDVSKSITEHTGVLDASVKLYPCDGYGDELRLLNIINLEKPDILLHISDPHNFNWLYNIDFQIRSNVPLMYYHVWDNDPIPQFNESVYRSCDFIGCISKKTFNIVRKVCNNEIPCEYIPHGVSSEVFFKIRNSEQIFELKKRVLGTTEYDFVVFSNNVNTPRKQIPNLIKAFSSFSREQKNSKVCLLIHCNPGSVQSINLKEMSHELYPDSNIIFTQSSFSLQELNELYNISDVVVNNASNEGFGLATLESLMTETPIIATDTGGLSDQMYDNERVGSWAFAIKPDIRTLNSSNAVPYIYDDICSSDSIKEGLLHWYNKSKDEISKCGFEGRQFAIKNFSSNLMTSKLKDKIQSVIHNFKPINSKTIIRI